MRDHLPLLLVHDHVIDLCDPAEMLRRDNTLSHARSLFEKGIY